MSTTDLQKDLVRQKIPLHIEKLEDRFNCFAFDVTAERNQDYDIKCINLSNYKTSYIEAKTCDYDTPNVVIEAVTYTKELLHLIEFNKDKRYIFHPSQKEHATLLNIIEKHIHDNHNCLGFALRKPSTEYFLSYLRIKKKTHLIIRQDHLHEYIMKNYRNFKLTITKTNNLGSLYHTISFLVDEDDLSKIQDIA